MASPPLDWGMIFMFSAATFGLGLTLGALWGQKTGPPKNWSEPVEPPDPDPSPK